MGRLTLSNNNLEATNYTQFARIDEDLVALNLRANRQQKDIGVIENQQMAFAEKIMELFQKMFKLEEACAKKDKCIHVLEAKVEHREVTIDQYADIIETLQMKVCCCNDDIVKTVSGSGEREESELEYVSESSKEEEKYLTPLPDLMTMVIDGCTP